MTNMKSDLLASNKIYAENFNEGDLPSPPTKKIAVLSYAWMLEYQ